MFLFGWIWATTLLLGPGDPQLLEGRTYAWRVRAIVSDGISETALFRNDGYSEIFHFVYQKACKPPTAVTAKALSKQSIAVSWGFSDHQRYRVQYRKKGYGDQDWFAQGSFTPQREIRNLAANTTYEYRVGGACDAQGGLVYSPINEITTLADEPFYDCGLLPDIPAISNRNPLPILGVNDVFTAGDFPITVKEATGSDGVYSGWGFVVMPFLGDTRIQVGFTNASINTDYQLTAGVVETDYDPDWGAVVKVDTVQNLVETLVENVTDLLTVIKEAFEDQVNTEVLSEEAAASILEEINTQTAALAESQETINAIKETITTVEGTKDEGKKQAEAKTALAEEESKLKSIEQALNNTAERLGVGGSDLADNSPGSDAYFDGNYPFTDLTETINRPDNNSPLVQLPKAEERAATFINKAFTLDGKPYRILVTTDTSPATALTQARRLTDNPDGTTLYYHYNFAENRLYYKVNFAEDFFGVVPSSSLTTLKELHKITLKKLIEKGLRTIDDTLIKATLKVNRAFAEAISDLSIPACSWNPSQMPCSEDGFNFTVHPSDAGIIDGLLEEVTGLAALVSLMIDYKLDIEARYRIQKAINDFAFKEAIKTWKASKIDQYSGSLAEIDYQLHKDFVTVASTFFSGGLGAATKGKKAADVVEVFADGVKKASKGITRILKYKPSWKPYRMIAAQEGKTTTLIGSFKRDMKSILKELDYPESIFFGAKNGDFNILKVPKGYNPKTFWKDYNKPWLEQAVKRGDDIIVMSDKFDKSILNSIDGELSGFGKEIEFMENLVKNGKYRYIKNRGRYIKIK